jgi:phage recombination protein Bet
MNENNNQVASMEPQKERAVAERITEAKLVSWMESFGLAKQLLPNEKKQFIEIATAYQLNPFKREIYCNAYGEGQYRQLSIITGYEVYLKRAERTGDLAGWNCTTEGSVEKKDLRAIITIHRKSWNMPLVHEVEYSEYIQTKKDGTPTKFWSGKPKTMIKKVAMAQGFRLAFPDELGGMPYTSDELPTHMTGVIETTGEIVTHSPKRKSETTTATEELMAKAEEAKKRVAELEAQEGGTDAPKSEPAKPQAIPDGVKLARGNMTFRTKPNAGGYVSFAVEGYQRKDGKDIMFSSKDPAILEILNAKYDQEVPVAFTYKENENPKFASNIIELVE